jgi:hypothetical protein
MGDVDSKFRDSLMQGLQLDLIGSAGFTVITTVVAGVMVVILHNRLAFNRSTFVIVAVWGLVQAMVWRLVAAPAASIFDPESLLVPTAAWLYLIAVPALMFVPLLKVGARSVPEHTGGRASAL